MRYQGTLWVHEFRVEVWNRVNKDVVVAPQMWGKAQVSFICPTVCSCLFPKRTPNFCLIEVETAFLGYHSPFLGQRLWELVFGDVFCECL